jgi:hypothetical protein
MTPPVARASRLALLAVAFGVVWGGLSLWFGFQEGLVTLWGLGGATLLLQVFPSLSLRERILEGLGNRGLERERRTLRAVSHLLRLFALGLALACWPGLSGGGLPQGSPLVLGVALAAIGGQGALWLAKRTLLGAHASLDLDASRTQVLLELALLVGVGCFLGRSFPWADAAVGSLMAVRLFLVGQTLAKNTTVQASCGGCGSGCGCG